MVKTQCVAKVLLVDSNGEFLLLKRSESHPRLAGFYDLPGGSIEPHEDYGDGLLREISEETGLALHRRDLKVIYTITMLLHGKSYPTLLYYGRVHEQRPPVTLSWEHQSYEWAPLDRLGEVEPQLAPTYREALEYVRHHGILDDIEAT